MVMLISYAKGYGILRPFRVWPFLLGLLFKRLFLPLMIYESKERFCLAGAVCVEA